MKKTLLFLLVSVFALQVQAGGDKYKKAMGAAIAIMDTAKSIDTYRKVANRFERIGMAEKKEWLPWYYAGLCYSTMSFLQKDPEQTDGYLDKAQDFLDKAKELSEENSEISAVQGMIYSARIGVDPQKRGMVYGPKAGMAYSKAVKLDDKNPRALYFRAQNIYFTPEQWGGGKDKAMPMLEKSLELFKAFKPKDEIHPNWGEENAIKFVEFAKTGGKMPWEEEEGAKEEKQGGSEGSSEEGDK